MAWARSTGRRARVSKAYGADGHYRHPGSLPVCLPGRLNCTVASTRLDTLASFRKRTCDRHWCLRVLPHGPHSRDGGVRHAHSPQRSRLRLTLSFPLTSACVLPAFTAIVPLAPEEIERPRRGRLRSGKPAETHRPRCKGTFVTLLGGAAVARRYLLRPCLPLLLNPGYGR
jgi:hypothetical protein